MDIQDYSQIVKNIKQKIAASQKILIVSSRPADPDSIGSNLSLRWFIENKYNKSCDSVIFGGVTERVSQLPGIEKVPHNYIGRFNFAEYDLIIAVDGSHWDRVFQDRFKEKFQGNFDITKFCGIDHHEPGDIVEEIPDFFLQKKEVCCTKIIYDYFLKDSELELNEEVATWLYLGLVDDTGRFTYDITSAIFVFAAELIKLGANHELAVDENYTKDAINFTSWAIYNTEFNEDIKSTILVINYEMADSLTEAFGENWERKILGMHYNESVMRKVEGYDYGIFFQPDFRNGGVRAGWRTRNYGNHISIRNVLEQMGFEAGGHFGAGGGYSQTLNIDSVRDLFIELMKKELQLH